MSIGPGLPLSKPLNPSLWLNVACFRSHRLKQPRGCKTAVGGDRGAYTRNSCADSVCNLSPVFSGAPSQPRQRTTFLRRRGPAQPVPQADSLVAHCPANQKSPPRSPIEVPPNSQRGNPWEQATTYDHGCLKQIPLGYRHTPRKERFNCVREDHESIHLLGIAPLQTPQHQDAHIRREQKHAGTRTRSAAQHTALVRNVFRLAEILINGDSKLDPGQVWKMLPAFSRTHPRRPPRGPEQPQRLRATPAQPPSPLAESRLRVRATGGGARRRWTIAAPTWEDPVARKPPDSAAAVEKCRRCCATRDRTRLVAPPPRRDKPTRHLA